MPYLYGLYYESEYYDSDDSGFGDDWAIVKKKTIPKDEWSKWSNSFTIKKLIYYVAQNASGPISLHSMIVHGREIDEYADKFKLISEFGLPPSSEDDAKLNTIVVSCALVTRCCETELMEFTFEF